MLVATGYFDKVGNPSLKISLAGVFQNPGTEIEAIIDTGFTGFLSIPIIQAFPIGLPLFGTTSLTLADGSTSNRLTALGKITLGNQQKPGVVILEQGSNEALIGMDFLRTFGLTLVMTKADIILFDEDALNQIKGQIAPKTGGVNPGAQKPPTA